MQSQLIILSLAFILLNSCAVQSNSSNLDSHALQLIQSIQKVESSFANQSEKAILSKFKKQFDFSDKSHLSDRSRDYSNLISFAKNIKNSRNKVAQSIQGILIPTISDSSLPSPKREAAYNLLKAFTAREVRTDYLQYSQMRYIFATTESSFKTHKFYKPFISQGGRKLHWLFSSAGFGTVKGQYSPQTVVVLAPETYNGNIILLTKGGGLQSIPLEEVPKSLDISQVKRIQQLFR